MTIETHISAIRILSVCSFKFDIFIWPLQYPPVIISFAPPICWNDKSRDGCNESPQHLISKRWKLWKFFNLVFKLWIRLKNVLLTDPSRLCMRFRARCLAGTIVRTFIGCWNFIGILRQLLPFKLQTAFERHIFASLAAKYVNEAALLVTHHFQVGFIYVEPYNCQYIFFKYKYISPNISHHGCVENCKTANLCLLIFNLHYWL